MSPLTPYFRTTLADAQPPCLSLYQPTHRHHPQNQQDPIRFGNLIKQLQQSLQQKYSADEVTQLLRPFQTLAGNTEFWNHTRDGLAVFAASGIFQVYGTQRPLPELAVVADSFHTKPLRRLLQTADRYQVLGLTRDSIRLFEGNRDALDEIDPAPGVPRTLTEALGEELTEPHSTVASYGGGAGAGGGAMHHGHGGKTAEIEIDDERFFRAVARAVTEHHSQPSKLPLILAALPEHQSLFRRVSHNPALLEAGITTNPDALSTKELRDQAWEVFAPQYQARLKALDNDAAYARSKETGSDDLTEVAVAAVAGRVQTLLIEAGRQLPGRLDPKTGEVTQGELDDPQTDDVLGDLADLVSEMGGEVVIVPAEGMTSETGLAAIYRY
ncbi:MAG: hypothetical protein H0W20_07475 [Chthoniobacterales bacterium]|nr:hypothetical protein [Chthoniobacterales bacterium]